MALKQGCAIESVRAGRTFELRRTALRINGRIVFVRRSEAARSGVWRFVFYPRVRQERFDFIILICGDARRLVIIPRPVLEEILAGYPGNPPALSIALTPDGQIRGPFRPFENAWELLAGT